VSLNKANAYQLWAAKQKMEEWMEELHAIQAERNAAPNVGPAANAAAAGKVIPTSKPL
jgi:hypothetical protein